MRKKTVKQSIVAQSNDQLLLPPSFRSRTKQGTDNTSPAEPDRPIPNRQKTLNLRQFEHSN